MTPQFRLQQRPALDGIRGVAMAVVMLTHYTALHPSLHRWLGGGFVSVEVFFVLSGFLITSLLLAEVEDTARWDARRFYIRRAFRLLPALYSMVIVCVVISSFSLVPRFGTAGDQPAAAGAAVFYLLNLLVGTLPVLPIWSAPLWSLCIEVHFYLLWPVLLVSVVKRGYDARWLALGVIAMSIAFRLSMFVTIGKPYYTITTPARLDGLAVGGLLAIAMHRGWKPPAFVRYVAPVAAIALFAFVLGARTGSWAMVTFGYSVVDLCAVAIILQALDRTTPTGRVLASRPLRRLGVWSYSLYLWHLPVIFVLARWIHGNVLIATAIVVSLLIAAASATFVEQPLRRRGRALANRTASVPPAEPRQSQTSS